MGANREYNKPNVKGPRYRETIYKADNDAFFQDLLDTYDGSEKYTHRQIRGFIRRFHAETVAQEILYTRYGVEVPSNIGRIFMGAFNQMPSNTKRQVNKPSSEKIDRVVKHANMETDSRMPFIYFTTWANKIKLMYHHLWKFKPHRDLARGMSKAFAADYRKYIVVTNMKLVSKLLR